jgi:hypothetical protein
LFAVRFPPIHFRTERKRHDNRGQGAIVALNICAIGALIQQRLTSTRRYAEKRFVSKNRLTQIAPLEQDSDAAKLGGFLGAVFVAQNCPYSDSLRDKIA